MTLHAYRSQRVEELVEALARALSASWPDDPFEPLPIVVGSRGMERWLRHELATSLDGLARVDFLFPRTAFDGAARWLAERPGAEDRTAFWQSAGTDDGWSGPRLAMRVVARLRARLGEPSFSRIGEYLGDVGGEVRARELSFASEVAATIEKLLHDRPDDALAWGADPASAPPEHAWLATLLRDLEGDGAEPSPAQRLAAVRALPAGSGPRAPKPRALFVFGLSTLRPGDKARLAALARHLDVHLFALAPSSEWWEDIRRASEQRAALRDADEPETIAALLDDLERKNAMLAANGAPSRELQLWLEAVGYDEPFERRPLDAAPTLLGRLHDFIERAADNPRADGAPWRAHAGCPSVEIHACHGPLRQCEALRDELLRRFACDETLEPRHVLVMTPDLATYAPLIAAVLARKSGGAPAIPLHVADLGVRATNAVADALLLAMSLADERVTASRLLDLLALPPVRARFRLDEDDLADLRTMILDAGIRWAWDARDRARHDQPALDQNTVRFGLERLALGVLMHDPSGLGVVPGSDDGALGPAVPLDLATRDRVERFGRLAEACARLERVRGTVLAPAPARVWRERLRALLDDLTQVDDDAAWLRVQVDETIDELLPDGADDLPFDRSAIASLLGGAFDLPQRGDRPVTGAVTVSALEPMRSVPFRVIAIVGLDDGAFPRPASVAAWDPFATPRRGEWDRRTIDRHLLLEAILCARDALLLFGNGFEPKRGAAMPLSVAVSELAEVIAAGLGVAPEQAVIRHPLQPWSERSFADPKRLPFDRAWLEAAAARDEAAVVTGLGATRLEAVWPEEENPPRTLDAERLANALARPQRELLGVRLGLALAPEGAEVPDREPLEQDSLDAWQVRDLVLRATADGGGADVASLEARLRGEGVLPLGAGGRHALETRVAEAREARRRAEEIPGAPIGALAAKHEVDGLVVTATIADVRADGDDRRFVWATASSAPNARLELAGWTALLVATASGAAVRSAHLVGHARSVELRAPADAQDAKRHLATLVETWRTLRRAPLPLFPALSRDVAERARKTPDAEPAELVLEGSVAWHGSPWTRGDVQDPWVSALFGHLAIDALAERAESIVALATTVWGPLLEAKVRA